MLEIHWLQDGQNVTAYYTFLESGFLKLLTLVVREFMSLKIQPVSKQNTNMCSIRSAHLYQKENN